MCDMLLYETSAKFHKSQHCMVGRGKGGRVKLLPKNLVSGPTHLAMILGLKMIFVSLLPQRHWGEQRLFFYVKDWNALTENTRNVTNFNTLKILI